MTTESLETISKLRQALKEARLEAMQWQNKHLICIDSLNQVRHDKNFLQLSPSTGEIVTKCLDGK